MREEKEIEQTVRGYRGGRVFCPFFFFPPPQFCTLNLMDVGCHILSDFVQGAMCHAVLEMISFRTRGRREKKWGFFVVFLEPPPLHLGALKTTQNPSHRPKFRLPPGLSFIIRVSVNNVRCGLNFSELCH